MHILFFSHYYFPEVNAPASRTSEHCRLWAEAGHDVTVVTCVPNHPRGVLYPGYKNRFFQVEEDQGVRVVRVWTYLAPNEGVLRRAFNYISYVASATLVTAFLPRPDIIVSTSPHLFCGLAGLLARLFKRRPWVLEIRDIWPESIITVAALRRGRFYRLLERLEVFLYRKADVIVAVTDSFVPHIAERCLDRLKVVVIKNGADLNLFGKGAGGKHRYGLEGRFVATYAGTHGMAQGLDTVLDAACALRHDPRYGFLLVGDGAERSRLIQRAKSLNLDNLRILGQLPKGEMPDVWRATDASMILLRRKETFTKVLPSKMFEAMAMGCPIILGVEGEAKAVLEQADAGIAITPESADELAAAIVRLAGAPELRRQLGRRGAAFVREHFDRRKLALRYLEVLSAASLLGLLPNATVANLQKIFERQVDPARIP